MRFSLGLLAAAVITANALPQDWYEMYPEYETCQSIESKSKENWQKYEIGEWFTVMANSQDIYDRDIQKTIQSWDDENSSLYGFYCSPTSTCDVNFDTDQCLSKEHPIRAKLYFILWSIANLNNWMASLLTAVDHTAGVADGLAADLVDTFATNMETVPISTAGSALAAGILGTLAAIVPAATVGGGFGAGVATFAGGLITLMNDKLSVELEPKFNDFTEVTKYIARASEMMQNSIESYGKWLLTEIPKNDRSNGEFYVDDAKALPNVLLNGDFAEPRISPNLPDAIYSSLFSSVISLLWKGEAACVVKIAHDDPTLLTPPCEDEKMFNGNKWCDNGGNAYLLLNWRTDWFESPLEEGLAGKFMELKGVDKLEDYRLSIENVVKASEHAASLNNGYPYYEWDTTKVMGHMGNDEGNMAGFSAFNLPFCEVKNEGRSIEVDDCDGECRVIDSMTHCFTDVDMEEYGFGLFYFEKDLCYLTEGCVPRRVCLGGPLFAIGC